MKAVLQVVTHATVRVDGGITGQIGPGLLVFLGVAEEDEQADIDKIVKKYNGTYKIDCVNNEFKSSILIHLCN